MKKTSRRTGASRKRSRAPRSPLVAFAELAKRAKLRWYVFGAADLDVTIDLAERSPAELVAMLRKAGFVPRFDDAAFIAETRVIPVVHRASGLPIDVVLAGPGLEQRFLDEVVVHRVAGRAIPVLSVENLVVTKMLAGRPKDLDDVRELLAIGEIEHARVDATLGEIETALGVSDLRPLYRKLRSA